MKTYPIVSLCISLLTLVVQFTRGSAQTPPAGIYQQIEVSGGGSPDLSFGVDVARQIVSPERTIDFVTYFLQPEGSAKLLRQSVSVMPFNFGAPIGNASVLHGTEQAPAAKGLAAYTADCQAAILCTYRSFTFTEDFNAAHSLLLGFRVDGDQGPNYGWLQLDRLSGSPTNAFRLSSYNYHPLPNEPIGAGLPPTPPPVTTAYDAAAGTLSLNWDARFPGLVLEATESLTEPVEWKPVPDASAPPAVLPVPEGDRFYRLRTQ
jgi:hypothetical protein